MFFSLYAVALKTADIPQAVYEEIELYLSRADDRYLDKLINGIIWANCCVSDLLKTCWGVRSQELFLVGKSNSTLLRNILTVLVARQSAASFLRYAESSTSRSEFLDAMAEKSCGRSSLTQDSAPILFIPLILEQIIGDAVP